MSKENSEYSELLGNENSYTLKFFEELHQKINLKDKALETNLTRTIILAAQAYIRYYGEYKRQSPPHEIRKELERALKNIDKAAESLIKVHASGNYGEEIINNLSDVILEKYPSLHSVLQEIRRGDGPGMSITSPAGSLPLLEALAESINRTLENFDAKRTAPRSVALYHWIMILSAQLEPVIGHKLEQSRYYKGEYVSKKKLSDSELLLFIISPLDPSVTISQIETVIKETREERHNAPWDDYFSM